MLLTILRGIYIGLKISAKCHQCGKSNQLNIEPVQTSTICEYTFVCKNCGALNTLYIDPNDPSPDNQEWLCLPPEGFEWILPSGKITPILGEPIYVSALGEYLSREIYINRYKLDPEIAYKYMRKKRSDPIDSKVMNKPSQSVVTHDPPDLSNIKKIEVLCKKCGGICELII